MEIAAAELQAGLVKPEAVSTAIEALTVALLPIVTGAADPKGPWMEAEGPENPESPASPDAVSESRDEDIPF